METALPIGVNVISLFENERFSGFGPSSLASVYELSTARIPLRSSKGATRSAIRDHCPATPGVYGMIGAGEELIYVGESKNLRKRLLSYFTGESPSAKARRIAEQTNHLVWERTSHEFTALLRELELIRRWQPRFNVRGNPRRARRAYLCVGHKPAPQAYLSLTPSAPGGWSFGPVPASRQYRRSIHRLNDCFGLRDCRRRLKSAFADQLELFSQQRRTKCIRGATGICLAPCATACSREEYSDRVKAVLEFLAGRNVAVLDRIGEEMWSASRTQRFELAARLRDAHEDLARLSTLLERLREVRRYAFVYPVRGYGGKEDWYLIRGGQIVAVQQGPRDPQTAKACLQVLNRVFPQDDSTPTRAAPEDLDVALLIAGWFRTHAGELKSALSADEARGLCG